MAKLPSRRDVLKIAGSLAGAAAAAHCLPVPAIFADGNPSRKLNVAAIGCGGRGLYLQGLSRDLNYVALAEPDQGNLDRALKNLAAAAEKAKTQDFDPARIKTFSDYRAMYDKLHKEIDLVLIATPDHQHACPSMMAIKLGKHVFSEKPLVHHKVAGYLLAQMLGGVAGGALVFFFYREHFKASEDADRKLACFCTAPSIRSIPQAFFCEVVGTFLLVLSVFLMTGATATIPLASGEAGEVAIGLGTLGAVPVALLVSAIGLSLGGTTGYAINPARDLGPRLAHGLLPVPGKRDGDWGYAWVSVIGPLTGGLLAVVANSLLS